MTNKKKYPITKSFDEIQKKSKHHIHDKKNDITFLNRNVLPKSKCSVEQCLKSLREAIKRSKKNDKRK